MFSALLQPPRIIGRLSGLSYRMTCTTPMPSPSPLAVQRMDWVPMWTTARSSSWPLPYFDHPVSAASFASSKPALLSSLARAGAVSACTGRKVMAQWTDRRSAVAKRSLMARQAPTEMPKGYQNPASNTWANRQPCAVATLLVRRLPRGRRPRHPGLQSQVDSSAPARDSFQRSRQLCRIGASSSVPRGSQPVARAAWPRPSRRFT